MARSVSLAPFRKFVRDIELQILRTSTAFVKRTTKRLEKEIEKKNMSFFTTLVRMGIDVPGPPALGEFTPAWKPLKTPGRPRSYAMRKARKYPGAGFFKYTGGLKRSLQAAKGSLLGKPTVTITQIPTQVKRSSNFKIVIEPAPALRNLRGINLLEGINGTGFQRSLKLSAFKGRITRPLLQPYLSWWVRYVITPSVVRKVK